MKYLSTLHGIENNFFLNHNHNAKVRGSCREGTIKVTNTLSDTETQASLPPMSDPLFAENFDWIMFPVVGGGLSKSILG